MSYDAVMMLNEIQDKLDLYYRKFKRYAVDDLDTLSEIRRISEDRELTGEPEEIMERVIRDGVLPMREKYKMRSMEMQWDREVVEEMLTEMRFVVDEDEEVDA